jgi:predicted transcriptional regulator
MHVLLSIHPEHAEKILSGEKKFEFRKNIFKNSSVKKVLIYATMPIGKVIGDFEIASIIDDKPNNVWKTTKSHAGISRKFFDSYFTGRDRAVAIAVKNPRRFNVPKNLSDLAEGISAPQSYRYIDAVASARW